MHGLLLCPRLLDGAVPAWRATSGACCAYSVLVCQYRIFDTGCVCSLRSMFVFNRCGVKVGTHDKQQAIVWRDNGHREDRHRGVPLRHTLSHSKYPQPTQPRALREAFSLSKARPRGERPTPRARRARERDALHGAWSRKSAKSAKMTTSSCHKLDTPHTFSRSGTLRARAHTGTHNTPRETTHTDRTDHSHRARATTKLRGVARRASYAVRAAQAVRVAPWRSRSSRWPREGRRRWRRQQSAPVMAPEH